MLSPDRHSCDDDVSRYSLPRQPEVEAWLGGAQDAAPAAPSSMSQVPKVTVEGSKVVKWKKQQTNAPRAKQNIYKSAGSC